MSTEELRNKILSIAAAEIGVWEDAGDNEDSAGRIAAYRSATGPVREPEPWCADFVSWVYQQVRLFVSFRSCERMREWAERNAILYPRELMEYAKSADVILFDENLNGIADHVGIIESIEPGGAIHTIEGNYNDSVSRVLRTDYNIIIGAIKVIL